MNNKVIKSVVISMLIIVTSCFGCYQRDNNIDKYLEKNKISIKSLNNYDEENFELFRDCVYNNDIFLAGEAHAIKTNYDLKLSLLIYFNEVADVKYLLIEAGYGTSGLINKYLETGNEKILDYIYADSKGAYECNIESYDFWKKLRTYNSSIPSEKRIKAIGIDMEFSLDIAFRYLQSIILDSNQSTITINKVQNIKNTLDNVNSLEIDDIKKMVELIKIDLESNKDMYVQYFGNEFFDFNYIIDNILNTFNAVSQDSVEYEIRERCMFNNFLKIYNNVPNVKYFGQFGLEHVLQGEYESNIGKFDRLAKLMSKSKESPVKNKVISIAYEYKDCYRMEGDKELPVGNSFSDADIFDKYSKEDITLFKLNGKNSPFKNRLLLVRGSHTGTTINYFQYIILIKNSRGSNPFHG